MAVTLLKSGNLYKKSCDMRLVIRRLLGLQQSITNVSVRSGRG